MPQPLSPGGRGKASIGINSLYSYCSIGRISGVTVGVADGVGVSEGVGLGVTGVLVGMGSGVSVEANCGTGVNGVAVGEAAGGGGVQVGGTKEPSPRSTPMSQTAVGTRVGSSAAKAN